MYLKNSILFFLLICLLTVSCDSKAVFSDNKTYPNTWHKDSLAAFEFTTKDSINSYDIFVNIRTEKHYRFNNLHLIVALEYPNGKLQKDTLEYPMTEKNGELLGAGWGIKEHKLWYKGYDQPFMFDETGTYKISIGQAMRKNGEKNGIVDLEAVTDVGISVEERE